MPVARSSCKVPVVRISADLNLFKRFQQKSQKCSIFFGTDSVFLRCKNISFMSPSRLENTSWETKN
jgi:hypothetical protein